MPELLASSRPDEPAAGEQERQHDNGIKLVEEAAKGRITVPPLAQHVADIGERKAPRPRAEERVNLKSQHRHAREPGRKRDEGSYDGQQAADKDGHGAIARKEAFGLGQFSWTNEDVSSPAFDRP